MSPSPTDLAVRFSFNLKTLVMATQGFEGPDWSRAPGDGGNCAHWVLGHLAVSRRYLVRQLGHELPEEAWEAAFGMSAKPTSTDGYPSPANLLADLGQRGGELDELLGAMGPERVDAPWGSGSGFPDGSNTLGGGASFLSFHEAYHVGQLGLIRRLVGKPGFI